MPDQNPFFEKAVLQNRFGLLADHFADGFSRRLKIVCRAGKPGGVFLRKELQIRQIYIYKPRQKPERFGLFIAAAVPDHRNFKPVFDLTKSRSDFIRKMGGRHQIDIFSARILNKKKQIAEFFPGKSSVRNPKRNIPPGNRSILTENAAEIAARKKDRARTVFPAQARFFPKVKRDAADLYLLSASAEPQNFPPVHPAISRTEKTRRNNPSPIPVFPIPGKERDYALKSLSYTRWQCRN